MCPPVVRGWLAASAQVILVGVVGIGFVGSSLLELINRQQGLLSKKFEVHVCLFNQRTRQYDPTPLTLKSTLLYENSLPVRAAPGEEMLTGDVNATISGGRGVLRLQTGKRALSAQHDHQRFRIKIEPADEQLAKSYPKLTQQSEPLKSVTKILEAQKVLGRLKMFSAAGGEGGGGGAAALFGGPKKTAEPPADSGTGAT